MTESLQIEFAKDGGHRQMFRHCRHMRCMWNSHELMLCTKMVISSWDCPDNLDIDDSNESKVKMLWGLGCWEGLAQIPETNDSRHVWEKWDL